jgi:hypothetical protein
MKGNAYSQQVNPNAKEMEEKGELANDQAAADS